MQRECNFFYMYVVLLLKNKPKEGKVYSYCKGCKWEDAIYLTYMFHYNTLEVGIKKKWVENLLGEYLEAYHSTQRPVREHLQKAFKVFIDMDVEMMIPNEVNYT